MNFAFARSLVQFRIFDKLREMNVPPSLSLAIAWWITDIRTIWFSIVGLVDEVMET